MPKDVDIFISRLLMAMPDIRHGQVRRLVPEIARMGDHALDQKLEYLRRNRHSRAPAKS
jgi:hypothetical protein